MKRFQLGGNMKHKMLKTIILISTAFLVAVVLIQKNANKKPVIVNPNPRSTIGLCPHRHPLCGQPPHGGRRSSVRTFHGHAGAYGVCYS